MVMMIMMVVVVVVVMVMMVLREGFECETAISKILSYHVKTFRLMIMVVVSMFMVRSYNEYKNIRIGRA